MKKVNGIVYQSDTVMTLNLKDGSYTIESSNESLVESVDYLPNADYNWWAVAKEEGKDYFSKAFKGVKLPHINTAQLIAFNKRADPDSNGNTKEGIKECERFAIDGFEKRAQNVYDTKVISYEEHDLYGGTLWCKVEYKSKILGGYKRKEVTLVARPYADASSVEWVNFKLL
jgi:hypothetical protein